jgi:hypothetical protein
MHETPGASRETPGASRVSLVSARGARTGEARREAWRVVAVAVLLAVTVIGLRTRGAFSHTPDAAAAGASGAVLETAMVAGEGIALAAFIVLLVAARPHRRPRDEQESERLIFPWWAKTAGVLLALGLLVTPLVVLLSLKVRKRTPVPPPLTQLTSPLTGSQPPNAAAQSSAWPLIAGMMIAIAVVLTLTWLTRRRRLPGRPRDRVGRAAALAEALAAGSAALQANHEPRAAIIACYAAMERGFAAAGSAPAAADTPAEVLARATAAGNVRSWSAEVLTGLFRRARYSAEPMTSADSAAAAAALIQLRADLADAGADAGAGAGAGAGR